MGFPQDQPPQPGQADPFGLIWTPMALARNARNMKKIHALAAGRQA